MSRFSDKEQKKFEKLQADRWAALGEAHARPALKIPGNAIVYHTAFVCKTDQMEAAIAQLSVGNDSEAQRVFITDVLGATIKIEKHTEYASCTIVQPHDTPVSDQLSAANLFDLEEAQILAAIEIIIVDSANKLLKALPFGERLVGGRIDDCAEFRTTLKPDSNGRMVFALHSEAGSPEELGRRVQRVAEAETYRVMTLLGLSTARRAIGTVSNLEKQLAAITSTNWAEGNSAESETAFHELSSVSAQLSRLRAETRYRFSASRAYFELVQNRLASFGETPTGDLQTASGFVLERLQPAMSTIESASSRQAKLADELANALALMRTRIELDLNRANRKSLASLDQRQGQQLLISQTVEGLSIVAITYYAVGLISYLIKAAEKADSLPVSASLAIALAVPIVLIFVATFLRRLRRHWKTAS